MEGDATGMDESSRDAVEAPLICDERLRFITISDTVASGERQDASGPARGSAVARKLKFTVESAHYCSR